MGSYKSICNITITMSERFTCITRHSKDKNSNNHKSNIFKILAIFSSTPIKVKINIQPLILCMCRGKQSENKQKCKQGKCISFLEAVKNKITNSTAKVQKRKKEISISLRIAVKKTRTEFEWFLWHFFQSLSSISTGFYCPFTCHTKELEENKLFNDQSSVQFL